MTTRFLIKILAFSLLAPVFVFGGTIEYDLTIASQVVNITGQDREAITINGGIPGPVLKFQEGDDAVLNVTNRLKFDTSIHWHGLLVPPGMDGVPYISYPPIKPGETFTYRFRIRQAGTYWYHSHSGLQEQQGLYGQIVITPKKARTDIGTVDHDIPVLLSDWTDEHPHQVTKTLRRGSEYYKIRKGTAVNLVDAARLGMLKDYFKNELVRMPGMDISDVYYDRFLANGKSEICVPAKPGETVRLRLVDGSASSFFYGEFAKGPMTIISADGQPVVPVLHDRLLIGTAETYDVLIKVPPGGGVWEFRATAHDSSGHASIWIGDPKGKRHHAPDVPLPNLYYSMGEPTWKKVFAFTPAGAMGMPDSKVAAGDFDMPGMVMNMGDMAMGKKDMEMGGMMMAHAMNTGLAGTPPNEEIPMPGMGMTLSEDVMSGSEMKGMNQAAMSGMPGMGNAPMDHSKMKMDQPPATPVPAAAPAMDHSKMKMDETPVPPSPATAPAMDHSKMKMDETPVPSSPATAPAMDHSKMKMDEVLTGPLPVPADPPATSGMVMSPSKTAQTMDHSTMAMEGTQASMPGMAMGGMAMDDMGMGPKVGGPIEGDLFDRNGKEIVVDGMNPKRPLPPYPKLRALQSTAFAKGNVHEIRLTLDGDMERYVWFLNNKALHEDDQIHIKEGEIVRFIMINRTMMYHPMHLHGHFFRVINGQGDYSPLKHTVTVMPMATTVFEFKADEVGDWFFHCHLLYHMHNGMARVVQYEGFTPDPETESIRDKLFEVEPYFYGSADIMSHMTDGFYEIAGIRYSGLINWRAGWANVKGTDYEVDLTFNYFQNRFLSLFAGAQLTNEGDYPGARGIFGYRYPLPFLFHTSGWVDTEGEFRFTVAKSYPITQRLHVFGEFEYDTHLKEEWLTGMEYILSKDISLTGNYHSEFGLGGGVTVRF